MGPQSPQVAHTGHPHVPQCETQKQILTIKAHIRGLLQSSWTQLIILSQTLWRYTDGLFFKVPPLASDALLAMLHPLLENML
jgi:hypothetical protein